VKHGERAHSKFSASGAERWFKCPGSVELSEGQPDKSSPWALEGTQAHEVLEALMRVKLAHNQAHEIEKQSDVFKKATEEMTRLGRHAAGVILNLGQKLDAEVIVENRVYLDFIHPQMFGTYDGAVIDHFGTLHVFDYKYGAGHAVSPKENLQMIFYGIGLAHKYRWNFKRVRLWIIQPRIKGYDGPLFWELPILELKRWVGVFEDAVERVEKEPETFVEGSHCHWCKAKSVCPLKIEAKLNDARNIFSINPIKKGSSDEEIFGQKETKEKSKSKAQGDWGYEV
jgi:hypothetical protein